ncbi:MAG: hypothetical protein ABI460_11875 [Caldimonas sp.]
MNATFASPRRIAALFRAAVFGMCTLVAACGGRTDAPPPIDLGGAGTAPTITRQPVDETVAIGQTAMFSVTASGDATLAYQWQRGGTAIAGATADSFTTPATALADSGAFFTVVVSNGVGSVTSTAATLTVSAIAPVLTITQQPMGVGVVTGAMASFTVAGTCSSGTLGVHWQRSQGGAAFADIAGATAATYGVATTLADNGAQYRAVLDCSGQSATPSSTATLTVTAPGTVTLTPTPVIGLSSGLAVTAQAYGIDQVADGSFVFVSGSQVQRLSADLSIITPVAGAYFAGSADGPAATASFSGAEGVVHDGAGNLFVTDSGNHTIRRIATDGTVTTIAGMAGVSGSADGAGSAARFNNPVGIALGPDGDLYVADTQNHLVRRVTVGGVVTTYAGSTQGYAEGPAATAQFNMPSGIAVASNGDVIVTDFANSRVRRIVRAGNAAGSVETLAGNGTSTAPYPDGVGTAAVIRDPSGIVLRGNTVVLQDLGGLLRQIDLATAAVTTITGARTLGAGYADGPLGAARLGGAGGIALAPNGGYVVATPSGGIATVSAAGDVRTIATARAFGVVPGGTGVLAQMPLALYKQNTVNIPQGVGVDPAGNIVLAEGLENDVRRISPTGAVTLVAGLAGSTGNGVDGTGSAAQFRSIGPSIVSDGAGVLYVADSNAVRRIGTDNAVTTLAGSIATSGALNGLGAAARFSVVAGLAVGPSGDVFACDPNNHAVRRIDAAGNVTTYFGVLGQTGNADGPVATARLNFPSSLAFMPDGSLLVADYGSVRRITPDGSSITTIYTVTGAAAAGKIVLAPDGSIYFGGDVSNLLSHGLYKLAPGASTPTVVVPWDSLGPRLGSDSSVRVNSIDGMALLGPNQLVVLTGGQMITISVP